MTDQLILDLAKQLADEDGRQWEFVPEEDDWCGSKSRADYISDARAALDVVLSHFARREGALVQINMACPHCGKFGEFKLETTDV